MAQKINHHNYTIPITEAFDTGGECPLCNMRDTLEKNALEYVLGPSYMEDGVRARTDKAGFCKAHYAAMFRMGNRLGLGLIVQTHARRLIDGAEALLEGGPPAKKIGLFGNAALRGMAHITGGGLQGNLNRILPKGLDAEIDLSLINVLPIFKFIKKKTGTDDLELLKTFNMGVGMAAVVKKGCEKDFLRHFAQQGYDAYVIGKIVPGGNQKVNFINSLRY